MRKVLEGNAVSHSIRKWCEEHDVILPEHLELAGEAGSTRSYWRVPGGFIFMLCVEKDGDFERFETFGRFFFSLGIRVPEIFVMDGSSAQMLLEDCGKLELYGSRFGTGDWRRDYVKTVGELVHFQEVLDRKVSACATLYERRMEKRALLWETSYFTENCLLPEKNISANDLPILQKEFTALAKRVNAHKKTVIHRDFQSRNILLKDGYSTFIDFQGARMGSLWYDLASLLWDPYVMLPEDDVWELYGAFRLCKGLKDLEKSREEFLDASLQRLMQACGAYAFLSQKAGKPDFGKFLEPGLERLRLVLKIRSGVEMPVLSSLLG